MPLLKDFFHTFPPYWSSPGTNSIPFSSSILPHVTAWYYILFTWQSALRDCKWPGVWNKYTVKSSERENTSCPDYYTKRRMRSRSFFFAFYNKAETKNKIWISKTLNKIKWMLHLGFCQAFGQQELCSWVWKYNAGNPTDDAHTTFASFNHCGSHLDEEQSTNSVEEGHFTFNMISY